MPILTPNTGSSITPKVTLTGEKAVREALHPGARRPAPAQLAVVQAFINSRWDLSSASKGETFSTAGRLTEWLRARGLIARGTRLTADDLGRSIAVREGLRALAFANNGRALDDAVIAGMRSASEGATARVLVEPEGPRIGIDEAGGIDAAIGAVLAMTAHAMIDGSWRRMKACPGRQCGWVFYDYSRNQSARWCSMKVCGGREKARAYYRRRTRGG
jgi:predicted RNA-binding Zn ribbon-like protein